MNKTIIRDIKNLIKYFDLNIDTSLSDKILFNQFFLKANFDLISDKITFNLSIDFYNIFQNDLSWLGISMYHKMNESIIEKFQDKVNWTSICMNQTLSEPFIEKFHDKVDWRMVIILQKILLII